MDRSRPLLILTLLVATVCLLGCQRDADREETASTPEEAVEEIAEIALIADWACADVEVCFGLEVGRSATYERRVGERVETETHTLADRVPIGASGDLPPSAHTFVDTHGEPRYQVAGNTLSIEMRGVLMEAIRFPVATGDAFTVTDAAGNEVQMTIVDTAANYASKAGEFGPCIVHEASFANEEHPDREGLRVETTMCQGIGQVARTIELPSLPLPVQFSLLGYEGLPEPDEGDRG